MLDVMSSFLCNTVNLKFQEHKVVNVLQNPTKIHS